MCRLRGRLRKGVIVPFARQTAEGFVVGEAGTDLPQPENYKEVQAVIGAEPWFDEEMLEAARWLAGYYMCPLAEAMRLFIPVKSSIKRHAVYGDDGKLLYYELENRLKEKTQSCYAITESGRQALAAGNNRAKAQMAALQILNGAAHELTAKELEAEGISAAVLRALVQKDWCSRSKQRVLRDSYAAKGSVKQSFNLTDEQQNAVDAVSVAKKVSESTGAVVAITGRIDTIAYKDRIARVSSGTAAMSKVTGTGCMLTGIIGAFVGAYSDPFIATVSAVGSMGAAGVRAYEKAGNIGTGSFHIAMIDQLSQMDDVILAEEGGIDYVS